MVTMLVMFFVGRAAGGTHLGGWGLMWRTAAAGLLTPIGIAILSIPSSLFGGDDPDTTAQAIILLCRTRTRRGDSDTGARWTVGSRPA